ncbi:glutathione peroxidase [Olivibacter sitiensis]|uniref:glutathione peroxidase n=1 Tax=Olivibacter sitiensis TaxID=376470 RepID=UPI00040CD5FD|nr:glutathione peroxidase [Olivibacter sitiensis]
MTNAPSVYDFSFQSLEGVKVPFEQFKGKKILIVNTASKCGFTPQYKDLETLSQKYKDKLVVIGFPANNFGQQEPGSNEDIKSFCEQNYGVTFLMAEKSSVKGDDISPLFKYLTNEANANLTGEVKWNFEKFLIDEQGHLIARFPSKVNPLSEELTSKL